MDFGNFFRKVHKMYLDSQLGDLRLNKKQHEKPEHDCDYCNHSQELFRALLLRYEPLFLTLTPQEIPTQHLFCFFFLQSAPTDAASADIKPSCFPTVGEKTRNHTDLRDQTIHNGRRRRGTISHRSNDTKKREQEQKNGDGWKWTPSPVITQADTVTSSRTALTKRCIQMSRLLLKCDLSAQKIWWFSTILSPQSLTPVMSQETLSPSWHRRR